MVPEVDFAAAIQTRLGPNPGSGLLAAGAVGCGFMRSPQSPGNAAIRVWVDAFDRAPGHYYGLTQKDFTSDIRCKVLSGADDLDGGWTLARAVREAMDAKAPAGYRLCVNELCEYVGQINEQKQRIFSVNFTLNWTA